MDFIPDVLISILALVTSWLQTLAAIPYGAEFWRITGLLMAAFFLCLLSGLAAGQVAERRGFAPHLHLVLGFVLPGLYPLFLPLFLTPETGSEVQLEKARRKARKEQAAAKAKEQKDALSEKQSELAREEADPGYWSRDRVDRIRLRPDGSAAGPFVIGLKDGRKFSALRITGTTPDCAIVEMAGNGEETSSLRLPLAQINEVSPADAEK